MQNSIKSCAQYGYISYKYRQIDGVYALIMLFVYAISIRIELRFISTNASYYHIITIVEICKLNILFIILKLQHQYAGSIGFGMVSKTTYILIIAISLLYIIRSLYYNDLSIIQHFLFSVVCVGITEEVIFRGYAHYRVGRLINNEIITLIFMGSIWGIFHYISDYTIYNVPINEIYKYFGEYILTHCLFILLYRRTGTVVHGIILHSLFNQSSDIFILWLIALLYLVIILKYVPYRVIYERLE